MTDDAERINLAEQIARIDALVAAIHKKQRERQMQPWQIFVTLTGGAAVLLAAGAALAKFLVR